MLEHTQAQQLHTERRECAQRDDREQQHASFEHAQS